MIFANEIATSLLLGLIGLIAGPFVGILLLPSPGHVCGCYWIIPAAKGAAMTGALGAGIGFVTGLLF